MGTPFEIRLGVLPPSAAPGGMDMKALVNFVNDDRGVDLIEYALLTGLIAAVSAVVLGDIGDNVKAFFDKIKTETAAPAAGG
jgi:pilus assembly protein Flp/PilA